MVTLPLYQFLDQCNVFRLDVRVLLGQRLYDLCIDGTVVCIDGMAVCVDGAGHIGGTAVCV